MAKILWIENQPEYLAPHRSVLREAGYDVREARSPQAAQDELKSRGQEYDLIILDILMGHHPVCGHKAENGRTGLAQYLAIRDDLALSTPIIFVTVMSDPAVEAQINQMERHRGLAGHLIQKPVRPSEVLKAVRDVIGPARNQEGNRDQA